MAQTRYLEDAGATERAGAALWQAARAPMLVFLEGDLGAGKTTLVRGLLRAAGHAGPVPSPTYTLVEPYALTPPVHHLDLYRLADPEELEMIGIRDILAEGGVVIVEWPQRGRGVLPEPDLRVGLSAAPPGRRLVLAGETPAGEQMVRQWAGSFDVTCKE
ncbi:tRNA (adenosine(37)-N6)-threonylcarbamoyltransferase complex ATPase subunit type 1 TsaE [Ectothiorhodospiraceae bacterium WFHF3C12]|nr:tRNA (adenosine(37)-N6)-threonylcarbamoyltransferase complex ATPase subunit type 1 TsaE [Ectothiorhodospiraceae bacterium WFHF3C12]